MNRVFAMLAAISLFILPHSLYGEQPLNPTLQQYVDARCQEFEQISAQRKALLEQLSTYISQEVAAGNEVKLSFICTHNSRRSHFGHLWAHAAATQFKIPNVHTYSGGTEATAFNPRAVAALQRAGFTIQKSDSNNNPVYMVQLSTNDQPQKCFSKKYDAEPNPPKDFGAVLVCSQADASCPNVTGAKKRFAIPFEDPKVSDGRDDEMQVYDERCAQIAREMLYVFSCVKK